MELSSTRFSSTIEEYLEAIYRLEEKTGSAKTSDLAKQLKVTLGTITNTVENLERKGLIIHEPYHGVKLTEKGRIVALDVIRRHRLSERLLTDILHMDWSEVHDEVCKLEHAISDDIFNNIEKVLGYPKTCPHGSPIPKKSGSIPPENSEPLINLDLNATGTIVKIIEEDPDILRYLASIGLTPGASIKVKEKVPFNGPILLEVNEINQALGQNIAAIIWIKKGLT